MIRGTTNTISISISGISEMNIKTIYCNFKGASGRVEKAFDASAIVNNTIDVHLSQEDTLQLGRGDVDFELSILDESGEAYKSEIIHAAYNSDTIKNEVMA